MTESIPPISRKGLDAAYGLSQPHRGMMPGSGEGEKNPKLPWTTADPPAAKPRVVASVMGVSPEAYKQLAREQGRPPNNFLRSTYYALGAVVGVCFTTFLGWGVALGWLVGGVLVPWAIFAYACRKDLHV